VSEKVYDLEERTFRFARNTALFCRKLPKNAANLEYADQAIRASGSVGANYIEANEALSKKDFLMRVKICRKEAKESAYWLRWIVEVNAEGIGSEGLSLKREAEELKKILSAIILKSN